MITMSGAGNYERTVGMTVLKDAIFLVVYSALSFLLFSWRYDVEDLLSRSHSIFGRGKKMSNEVSRDVWLCSLLFGNAESSCVVSRRLCWLRCVDVCR